jgi:L-fuconate dehydratase
MLWFHCAANCQLKHYFLRMRNGRYVAPSKPGYSAEMFPESIAKYSFPDGEEWRSGA